MIHNIPTTTTMFLLNYLQDQMCKRLGSLYKGRGLSDCFGYKPVL